MKHNTSCSCCHYLRLKTRGEDTAGWPRLRQSPRRPPFPHAYANLASHTAATCRRSSAHRMRPVGTCILRTKKWQLLLSIARPTAEGENLSPPHTIYWRYFQAWKSSAGLRLRHNPPLIRRSKPGGPCSIWRWTPLGLPLSVPWCHSLLTKPVTPYTCSRARTSGCRYRLSPCIPAASRALCMWPPSMIRAPYFDRLVSPDIPTWNNHIEQWSEDTHDSHTSGCSCRRSG
jgi:hypothetical protein